MTIILADLPSVTSSFITIPYPTNQQEFCLLLSNSKRSLFLPPPRHPAITGRPGWGGDSREGERGGGAVAVGSTW